MTISRIEVKKILVALDLSEYSHATFSHALTLAEKFDAELVVLNVINSEGLEHLDRLAQAGYPDLDTDHYLSNLSSDRKRNSAASMSRPWPECGDVLFSKWARPSGRFCRRPKRKKRICWSSGPKDAVPWQRCFLDFMPKKLSAGRRAPW